MGKHDDKEHRSHRRGQPGASGNPLPGFAQQALQMGGHSWTSSPAPTEAQHHSSTPATSGYGIQPRPAPSQQGSLSGTPPYTGGVYAGTAQYSASLTSEPPSVSGGYSGSAHQQTTEEHKRGRESSSSSGDQQHEHERSHHENHRYHHKHKKPDYGSGHQGSQRGESQSGGQSNYNPSYQPGNQGASVPAAAPQYQPGPGQNTSWPTNAPATASYGQGGGSAFQPAGGGGLSYGGDIPAHSVRQPNLAAGFPGMPSFPPIPPRGEFPPMNLPRPQLAPMPPLPRQRRRRDEVFSMVEDPVHLAPIATQPQPRNAPSLQAESQRHGPMQPPVPTPMEPPLPSWSATGTGDAGQGAALAAPPCGDPNFNVVWRGDVFDVSHSATKGWSDAQVREARVLIASFASWDEVEWYGQGIPGARAERTVVHLLKDDARRWGLENWKEWTGVEDKKLWENRAPYPGEDIVGVATRIQPLFPGRMIGELVGRLKLFARINKHPDGMGRTIGAFPHLRQKERQKKR